MSVFSADRPVVSCPSVLLQTNWNAKDMWQWKAKGKARYSPHAFIHCNLQRHPAVIENGTAWKMRTTVPPCPSWANDGQTSTHPASLSLYLWVCICLSYTNSVHVETISVYVTHTHTKRETERASTGNDADWPLSWKLLTHKPLSDSLLPAQTPAVCGRQGKVKMDRKVMREGEGTGEE